MTGPRISAACPPAISMGASSLAAGLRHRSQPKRRSCLGPRALLWVDPRIVRDPRRPRWEPPHAAAGTGRRPPVGAVARVGRSRPLGRRGIGEARAPAGKGSRAVGCPARPLGHQRAGEAGNPASCASLVVTSGWSPGHGTPTRLGARRRRGRRTSNLGATPGCAAAVGTPASWSR